MKTTTPRPSVHRRGFALLTVLLLVAIFTVSALVALEIVRGNLDDVGTVHRRQEAKDAAEGGLMEALNDRATMSVLPTFTTPNLTSSYTVSSGSRFSGPASASRAAGTYNASFALVRMAPLLESSHTVVRAVIYQVDVEAKLDNGAASAVEAEVYRVVSAKSGAVQPRIHAR
jgi:hypothetical protein